jgi:hypothetical protein
MPAIVDNRSITDFFLPEERERIIGKDWKRV